MSDDGEYEDDMAALIEADQQAAAAAPFHDRDTSSSSNDALPSLEQVDGGDNEVGGGGFVIEEQQLTSQQKEQLLAGNKRKHSELSASTSVAHTAATEEDDDLDDITADDIDRLIAQHEQSINPSTTPLQSPHQSTQPLPPSSPSTSDTVPPPPTSAILSCTECSVLAYNVPYYKAFNLLVCNDCQKRHPATYQLVLKSVARTQYLLTDGDFTALPHLLRPNRTRGSFANYKLYRLHDILAIVIQRYGSEAALEEEKQRKELEKLEKDVAKRRKGRAAVEKEKRVREWKMEKEVEGKGHKHTYVDVLVKGKKKQQCSSCKFTLEFEEL